MKNPFLFTRLFQAASKYSLPSIISFVFHLPNFIRLFSRLLADPRVPAHLKLICYGAVIYLIFPIDLVRDLPFIQIGYIDDAIILIFAFRKLLRESPSDVVQELFDNISS